MRRVSHGTIGFGCQTTAYLILGEIILKFATVALPAQQTLPLECKSTADGRQDVTKDGQFELLTVQMKSEHWMACHIQVFT
jgi:hypothetical protein